MSLLLAAALSGCFSQSQQASLTIDFGGQGHEPDVWTFTVAYDPDDRPTQAAYDEVGATHADGFTVHDLMAAWSDREGIDVHTEHFDSFGFSLEAIDGVASDFEDGCWFWELSVNGVVSEEGMGAVVLADGDEVSWTYTDCA